MSVHMKAVSAANREAIHQEQLMDSVNRLQEILERGDTTLGTHTTWSAQWAAVCIGSTVAGPPSPCFGAPSQGIVHSADDGENSVDLTLVVAFSDAKEQAWRRPEGEEEFHVASVELGRGSGLRCRPARLSTLMLQAVAANRSAASSVDQHSLWTVLRTPRLGERYAARRLDGVGRLGTLAVARG